MTSPAPTLALIVPSNAEEQDFERQLGHAGLTVERFRSLGEFREGCVGHSYSGVAIDPTLLSGLDACDARFVADLEASFTVLRIRASPAPDYVAGVIGDRRLAGDRLLDHLVALCRRARPRGVRVAGRKNTVLSVTVQGRGCAPFRASVANVSSTGLFIVTPQPWPEGPVEVVVKDFDDPTPIPVELRWSLPWGVSNRVLPGFGVAMRAMTAAQRARLDTLLADAPER